MLASLALGIVLYEQGDYEPAVAALKRVRVPQIADYSAYFLAAARVEANDVQGVVNDLTPAHTGEVPSPLSGKAWLLAGRALQAEQPDSAVRVLREHYAELPQPDGDLTLADAYQAAKDLPQAVEFYQRVYYQYLTGEAPTKAAAALVALKDSMGDAYPEPLPQQQLRHADRLLEAHEYARAAEAYRGLSDRLVGLERDQARVRAGAADMMGGHLSNAVSYLRSLELGRSEADAERLFYLEDGARRANDDASLQSALEHINRGYPKSSWRLRALITAATRFLLVNRPSDYVPLYRAAYEDFPSDANAGLYHWKVTFQAYLRSQSDAKELLREHLKRYPTHPTAGASVYFSGRLAERDRDPGVARACYERLVQSLPNTYYAMLARDRLQSSEMSAAPAGKAPSVLEEWKPSQARPVPSELTRASTLRIERSRLLRTGGLDDLADAELRFGARTDGQPALLAMEAAGAAETPHRALRLMKTMTSDYLSLRVEDAPRKYWELLYPLPYRNDLDRFARDRGIDPFLLAGLIRQESEFNPEAVSHANAYGLTQVRPGTGREFARRAGVQRFTSRALFQPVVNLQIGSLIFRSMLDRQGGRVEPTLAAYNAGPVRAAEWLSWNEYREPAEFVESIPFTETRDYVQAVLRNADFYRRLYRQPGEGLH